MTNLMIKIPIEHPVPATNENTYEMLWAARLQIFHEACAGGAKTPFDIMASLSDLERRYTLGVELLPPPVAGELQLLNGVVRGIPTPHQACEAVTAYNFNPVLAVVAQQCDPSVKILVELGCGYGRNLIELRHHIKTPDLTFMGAEYTRSGREAIEFFNTNFPDPRPIVATFTDHRLATFPFIPREGKTLVFTCHSLEQVEKLPLDFFVNLAASSESITGVHIEPFGFQVVPRDEWNDTFRVHNAFARYQGYNLNMMSCLEYAVREKAITLSGVALNVSFAQPENPSSVVVWKKYAG